MDIETGPGWTFLTNHAQVLLCITHDPDIRLRDIGGQVGITERAAHRIVADLVAAEYITRTRVGRRNLYTVNKRTPIPEQIARERSIGELLQSVTDTPGGERRAADRRANGSERRVALGAV